MTLPAHVCTRSIDARRGGWPGDPERWLSRAEQEELAHWRNPTRRDEWLAGRWLLKQMILGDGPGSGVEISKLRRTRRPSTAEAFSAAILKFPHPTPERAEIEILSRDPFGRRRPPCVLAGGQTLPIHASLAHAGGVVWVAVSTLVHVRVGIDVVPAGSFGRHDGRPWFTDAERGWLERSDDPALAATLWAAKEAIYKATNRGEPFVPARINVGRDGSGQYNWSCDGTPPRTDAILLIRRSAESIIGLAVVNAARADTGGHHD